MSEILPLLPSEAHKPEFPADAHALSYGGGTSAHDTGHLNLAAEPSSDTAQFPGGLRSDAARQMDSLHAQGPAIDQIAALMAVTALSPGAERAPSGTSPDTTPFAQPGTAVAFLPGITPSGAAGSAIPVDATTGLPRMQFISDHTAMRASAPEASSESTIAAIRSVPPCEPVATPSPEKIRQDDSDTPTSLWDIDDTQPGGEQAAHSRGVRSTFYQYDPSNNAFAGSYDVTQDGVVNYGPTVNIDLSGGGGGYPRPSSGGGNQVLGPPVPPYDPDARPEMILTDAEIQQQSQDIYGYAASADDKQWVLDQQNRLIPRANIRDWLAHDARAKNALVNVIEQTLARPYGPGDEEWIKIHQNKIGQGEETIRKVRQDLAQWNATHGGYDAVFQQTHGFPPNAQDRKYAGDMIGSGWSVQDYRWNEAHGERTAAQLRDLIPAVQGRPYQDSDAGWVRWKQDQLGNSQENMQQTRKDLATWSAQTGLYDRHFEQVHGFKARPEDRVYAGNMIGNGWSVNDYRWNEAHAGWTAGQLRDLIPAVQDRSYQDSDAGWVRWKQDQLGNGHESMQQVRKDLATWSAQNGLYDRHFEQVHGISIRPEDRLYAGNMIGNGWSVQDYRRNEALSEAAARNYRAMYKGLAGKDPTDDDVRWLQTTVANGSNFLDIRHNLAWSPHGRDAVAKAYAEVHGTTAQSVDLDYGSGKLAQGQTLAEYRHAEVYNGQTAQQYRAMFVNLTGVEPGSGDVSWLLDAAAKGSNFLTLRNNLAWSPHGRDAVQRVFARTAGIQNPTQRQFDWYQRALATGSSISDITNGIARAWEGESAVKRAYTEAGGITPSDEQIRSWVNGLAQGTSYTDMRGTIARNEGSIALKDIALKVLGRTISPEELANQQAELTNGKTLADLRHAAAFSQEATSRLTQQTADLIHKAGIEQGLVWSGVPEALTSLQGNIAAGQATMGQVQTAIARCMFATCFPGSTTTPVSVLQEFSAIAARGTATAAEGMSAAAMAESAAAIIGEIVADAVATPVAVTAAALWPQPTNQFYDPNGNAISESTWVQRENLRQNVIAQIKEDKTFVWTGNLGGGEDPNDKLQVHHCVPIKMDTAQAARDILDKWQIGINDPANASIIPRSFHFSKEIHGGEGAKKNYGDLISQYMAEADRLADIESKRLGGGDAGFKAGRADVMESLRTFCDRLTYKSKDPNAIVFQEIMRNVEKGVRQIVNGK